MWHQSLERFCAVHERIPKRDAGRPLQAADDAPPHDAPPMTVMREPHSETVSPVAERGVGGTEVLGDDTTWQGHDSEVTSGDRPRMEDDVRRRITTDDDPRGGNGHAHVERRRPNPQGGNVLGGTEHLRAFCHVERVVLVPLELRRRKAVVPAIVPHEG